ncbi:lytic polysaccharide monooxygenase [Cellulomonas sp. URHB0016]
MSTTHALRRRGIVGAAIAGLAAALVVALPATGAEAHGGLTFPQTRTYACYQDGLAGGAAAGQAGNVLPTNQRCKDALAVSNYPFYNWFGDLRSFAAGQHHDIPDGKLCGPDTKFDSFNTNASGWPTTTLQSGSTITFQYAAVVPHPGSFTQYITKDGWDQTKSLGWDDLEPAYFDKVLNPPIRQGGPAGPEYYWSAKLPNKSGRHIIYSIWERTDSPEAFYNCADVTFTGGSVTPTPTPTATATPTPTPTPTTTSEPTPTPTRTGPTPDVTPPTTPGKPVLASAGGSTASLTWEASTDLYGIAKYQVRDATTNAVLATTTTNAAMLSGLTPSTQYSVYVTASDPIGNVSAASPTLTFSSGAATSGGCQVKFDVSNAWSGGFVGQVSVSNDSMSAISGWELKWTFTNGEKVTQGWNSVTTQSGTTASAKNAAWNSTIAHHGSVAFGFQGTGTPAAPTGVTLNGTACTLV